MSFKRTHLKFDQERFQRRLERRLKGCVTLPFSRELWEYRTLVEKKKTRKILRLMNTLTRLATVKKVFPYPTIPEQFMQEYDDSDSSYGRDESILFEGYYIVDQLYGGFPGRKIYLCQKSLFSGKSKPAQVALKVVNVKKAYKDYVYNVLPRELDFILRVKHPFILETLCVIYRRKEYFIFMRYAEKSDLFAYLVNYGRMTEVRCRIWISQLAQAVDYIHSLDIVHRDICCENILITAHNNLKLTDFENSLIVDYDMGIPVPLVEFRGTLEYATPEILAGRPYHAKGADTWALTVVLYCMLTAHLPFAGSGAEQLLQSQRNWQLYDRIGCSMELGNLFQKMFQFKSSHRYNLQRFMKSEWFRKETRMSSHSSVPKKCRPRAGECRPVNDPIRLRLIKDPYQEHTQGHSIRFKPFLETSPSTCTLIPTIFDEVGQTETLSEDLSYGIPFTPGEEHKAFLGELVTTWGRRNKRKT